MKENYSIRHQKIYSDYVGCSTDSLVEMIKSPKYVSEVSEIMKDIIIERNPSLRLSQEPEREYDNHQSLSTQEINNTNTSLISNPLYGVKGWLKLFVIVQLYISPVIFIVSERVKITYPDWNA